MKFSLGKIIALCVLLVIAVSGFSFYGYANSTRSEGMVQEQAMSAQYKMNENDLSTYMTKIYEMTDVANLKSSKMDTILSHAIQGRYGTEGFKANGAFFASVKEEYPKIDLSLYDKLLTAVESGRDEFKNKQDKLTDMKRAYDTWRIDGMVRSYFTEKYFPSENLKVSVNGKVYVGKDALAKIDQMVLNQEASQAFDSGKMPTLDLKHR